MSAIEPFGKSPSNEPVFRIAMSGGGLTASVLTWGAVIQDLRIEGHDAPLVLGYDRLDLYIGDPCYFGAVVGRSANRIRRGVFSIDGQQYAIEPERAEANGLHGGSQGYAQRNWSIADSGSDFVVLSLHDPDGTMGFPGALDLRCTYRLGPQGTLSMVLEATTDRPTVCNLAQHSYFNLDDGGASDMLDHTLRIEADRYLEADSELVSTGEIREVDGTVFDFRAMRPIRHDGGAGQVRYDRNFCLSQQRRALARAATAKAARSGLEMEVWTTEPGVQLYSGHYIPPGLQGLEGRTHQPFAGFCLEAQDWPDSPNHPHFPQAILRPEETYRQQTEYRFRKA